MVSGLRESFPFVARHRRRIGAKFKAGDGPNDVALGIRLVSAGQVRDLGDDPTVSRKDGQSRDGLLAQKIAVMNYEHSTAFGLRHNTRL